jgi:hypothetical protein
MKYFLVFLLLSLVAHAHNEDKPGPNGGHIKMPSSYHTELVLKEGAFEIFLSDVNFKNPMVKDSKLEVYYIKNKKKEKLKCSTRDNFYRCDFKTKPQSGELLVSSKRNGIKGKDVSYQLPLKFSSVKKEETDSHANHH